MDTSIVGPQTGTASLIVMGVSGSGKSRVSECLARALKAWRFVDGDRYHDAANVEKMRSGTPLTDADREGWLITLAGLMAAAEAQGTPIVLACSALKRRYRDVLRTGNPGRRFVVLEGSATLLAQRMEHRPGHFMPPSLLKSQLDAFERPAADEHAVFCDIAWTPAEIVERALMQLGIAR